MLFLLPNLSYIKMYTNHPFGTFSHYKKTNIFIKKLRKNLMTLSIKRKNKKYCT